MNTLLGWLTSRRRAEPVSAAEIRRELAALERQHQQANAARDALALDAVNSEAAAERWQHLDASGVELCQRIAVLRAALPVADAREADATRQAEAEARAQQLAAFSRRHADAERWTTALLQSLPTGETLTAARDLRDALQQEAADLRQWSNDARVRRPSDPLATIADALALRVARIERARSMHGRHPITLGTAGQQLAVAEAAARLAALGGTQP